jgi:hypothetical protein
MDGYVYFWFAISLRQQAFLTRAANWVDKERNWNCFEGDAQLGGIVRFVQEAADEM